MKVVLYFHQITRIRRQLSYGGSLGFNFVQWEEVEAWRPSLFWATGKSCSVSQGFFFILFEKCHMLPSLEKMDMAVFSVILGVYTSKYQSAVSMVTNCLSVKPQLLS